MAISKNPLFIGMSGRIGDLVFRQCNGKTIIAKAPGRRKSSPSAAQLKQQRNFAEMVMTKKIAKRKK